MAGVNKCLLVGRVGKDPEIRSMQSGDKVASFSLATSETWKDRQTGEKKEKVEWHNVAVFNENLVRIVEQYVHKGDMVYVEGALQTRKWQDRDGNDRYTTEIVLQKFRGEIALLGGKQGGGEREERASAPRQERRPAPKQEAPSDDHFDDRIPF